MDINTHFSSAHKFWKLFFSILLKYREPFNLFFFYGSDKFLPEYSIYSIIQLLFVENIKKPSFLRSAFIWTYSCELYNHIRKGCH